VNDAALNRADDGIGAIGHPQFFVDGRDVGLDGTLRYEKRGGDFLVALAAANHFQDFDVRGREATTVDSRGARLKGKERRPSGTLVFDVELISS
jgi:hypothetical protein